MKQALTIFLFLSVIACSAQLELPNLSQPPQRAELFAKNLNTFMNERDFAISPDGNEIFFTIAQPRFTVIMRSVKQKNGSWSVAEVAPFSGRFSDLEAAFSPDGKTLFFASNRPLGGETPKDFDLWKVNKTKDGWSEPQHLGMVVNTSGNEFYPSVTRDGSIFFTARRENGIGAEDIFVSRVRNGQYQTPEPLDSAVNSKGYEFNAFVDPAERYIILTCYGRSDDAGGGDLYISYKKKDNWSPVVRLDGLSSTSLDYCPFVSPDGNSLFFTSERSEQIKPLPIKATSEQLIQYAQKVLNGAGNLYWVSFEAVKKSDR